MLQAAVKQGIQTRNLQPWLEKVGHLWALPTPLEHSYATSCPLQLDILVKKVGTLGTPLLS